LILLKTAYQTYKNVEVAFTHSQQRRRRIENEGSRLNPSSIKPHTPRQPAFRKQIYIDSPGTTSLNDENTLALCYNILPVEELNQYIKAACEVDRVQGKSAFNSLTSRKEICYTVDGRVFRYSGHDHITTKYPKHALQVVLRIYEKIQLLFPHNPYHELSTALDILYSNEFERGGKVGAHGDKDDAWGIVAILSLGQTRWLRLRRVSGNKEWYNVEMKHNSLTIMYGKTFQQQYTHQVDPLMKDDIVYPRLSFNIRFSEGVGNIERLLCECDHEKQEDKKDEEQDREDGYNNIVDGDKNGGK
jgi:alkylated DNA repair dioxygenase AlkB